LLEVAVELATVQLQVDLLDQAVVVLLEQQELQTLVAAVAAVELVDQE
jgi:hypothetical protein